MVGWGGVKLSEGLHHSVTAPTHAHTHAQPHKLCVIVLCIWPPVCIKEPTFTVETFGSGSAAQPLPTNSREVF